MELDKFKGKYYFGALGNFEGIFCFIDFGNVRPWAKEFWPEEFYSLLNRYFVDITLYGQCDVNLKDKSVERNCGVHKFKDSEHISSAYIIAVAKKETKSNTLCQYPKSQLSS